MNWVSLAGNGIIQLRGILISYFLKRKLLYSWMGAFGMGMIVEIHDRRTIRSIGRRSDNAISNMI